jgi:spore germination cell wall hydrolase CwlJ-like protein
MDISLKTNSATIGSLAANILRTVGFILVIWAVTLACKARLNHIKETQVDWPHNYVSATTKIKELDCLTRNIYWEAASEPFEGKVGVAQVTINRVESGKFAGSICEVVYQKNIFYEKVICQFSWYCENTHKTKPIHKALWAESELVAKKVLLENFRLPALKNALYYHADYINPGWKNPKIEQIGRHIFYGDKKS